VLLQHHRSKHERSAYMPASPRPSSTSLPSTDLSEPRDSSSTNPQFVTPNFGPPSFESASGTRNAVSGSVAHELSTARSTAALTFAGQGWSWWVDLGELLERRSWIRPVAAKWAGMLAELASQPWVRDLGGAPSGFDPLGWVSNPESAPSGGELSALQNSVPGVLLTQLLVYREAYEDGLAAAIESGSIIAATGHSAGIIAAAAVAAQADELKSDELLLPFFQLSILLGHIVGSSSMAVTPAVLEAALTGDTTAATPMVAVNGIRQDRLAELLLELNSKDEDAVRIALHHAPNRVVLSGSPEKLMQVRGRLVAQIAANPAGGKLTWEPLAVAAPCHHSLLETTRVAVCQKIDEISLQLPLPLGPIALVIPDAPRVFDTQHSTAQGGHTTNLAQELTATVLTRPGIWDRTIAAIATGSLGLAPVDWLIDCGPCDGVARLTAGTARGTGARVLALSQEDGRRGLLTVGAAPDHSSEPYIHFAPQVVTLADGRQRLENLFTRSSGRSPMVLPGMTPTTVDAGIVAAAANQGFLAELAGGGQVTEQIFDARMQELSELLNPGQEIVFNALHLDPYLWGLHIGRSKLVQNARRAGAAICGVTISAGIPEVEAAVQILDELAGLGIWCNAFKPGTPAQIAQVVAIAQAAPSHTIFAHVEGGTAGGHHSWVDLEDLLLAGYHGLRSCPNLVICVGGGIGTPERAAEYLTGSWSLRHLGIALPVDAILLGTVTMAVAEATATQSVKQALCKASGTQPTLVDAGFIGRSLVAGQVTSGRSGLDADIHFLDNAASRCAALLDQVAGNAAAVEQRKDDIATALAGTAKPFFGEVADMTYEKMLQRFVQLTALGRDLRYEDGRWLDPSHRNRFIALLQRSEARLNACESGEVPTLFSDPASVDDPDRAITDLLVLYPRAAQVLLHPGDPSYFLAVCRRPGKPVPFVPVIDADVRRWYQSDSLWQAQHPAFDADQVLVIPGPAAVGGIQSVDEPVADLLTRFEDHLVDQLISGGQPVNKVTRLRRHGPTAEFGGALAALLEAPTVVCEGKIIVNPALAFAPIEDWVLNSDELGVITHASLTLGGGNSQGSSAAERTADQVELALDTTDGPNAVVLTVSFAELTGYGLTRVADPKSNPAAGVTDVASVVEGGRQRDSVSLRFLHTVRAGIDILQLDHTARTAELTTMLNQVLIRGSAKTVALGESITVNCSSDQLRSQAHARLLGASAGTELPDSWNALVWPAVFAALGAEEIVGSLLDLVHLEHSVTLLDQTWSTDPKFAAQTELQVTARVSKISAHSAGTQVDTLAEVCNNSGPILRVEGAFLLRNTSLVPFDQPDPVATLSDALSGTHAGEFQDRPRVNCGKLTMSAPSNMSSFAAISGDHNPIHRSAAIARLAGLDGPIVHGAWTSAFAQRAVIELCAATAATRLVHWDAKFLAPVVPGEQITVNVVRTGVRSGRTIYEVNAIVHRPTGNLPALTASAELLAPSTAYLFPGQGIQRPGMGMDGYERSVAAKNIWDRADLYTREELGFSILSIVRDNPTVLSADSELHRHPQGVLHLTQFTQVAMAALASAQIAELQEAGVFDDQALVAGHSVGEYNALAALGQVLELEQVVELVFRRGQVMSRLVPRDAAGNSNYRLGVIRPQEVDLDHAGIESLVADLRDSLGETLEIVNFNLRNKQYAVAGTISALDALELAVNTLAQPGSRAAFIYVPGIDVPFHSSALRDGVDEFRSHLDAVIPERINPELLVGRYVPNLVPRVFSLQQEFVQEVSEYAGSAQLASVLDDWEGSSSDPGRLCRSLLVELLAWQFASPVRWIETQDLLFGLCERGGLGIERVIEVGLGSAPTVANLARGTLALGEESHGQVEVFNCESDRQIVFAIDEQEAADNTEESSDAASPTPPEAAAVASTTNAEATELAPAPTQPATQPATQPVADLAMSQPEAMRILLSLLCKVRADQLLDTESIDDLVDGVSSRRNQLLMDLGEEFNISGVDGARELPLQRLGTELAARASRYAFPGPVLRDARDAALAPVLGPLRLKARDVGNRVNSHWNLGPGWTERVLAVLAFEGREGDSARGGSLGRLHPLPNSGDTAIDLAVQLAAADAGVAVADPSATSAGGAVDAAAVAELEARIAGADGLLASAARDLLARIAPTKESAEELDTSTADRLALLEREHGDRRATAVAPAFDARRHVAFTSYWGTARHDMLALHHAGYAINAVSADELDALSADELDALSADELDAEASRLARFVVDPGVRASAIYFAGRAAARSDDAAKLRFEKILQGHPWVVPVPLLAPTLAIVNGERVAAEAPAPLDRLESLVQEFRSNGTEWGTAYADALRAICSELQDENPQGSAGIGLDLTAETALVTGASPGSIAVEVVVRLLAGGAKVICTSSNLTQQRMQFYRELYNQTAAPGAELHVVPANMASFEDIDALVDWITTPVIDRSAGFARTIKDPFSPTLILPFAAGTVSGDLADAGPAAEVAMRVLVWGVERLVGRLVEATNRKGAAHSKISVMLPLSPNHGRFGGDGAYGEAKAALEVFIEKWGSEQERWGSRTSLIAPTIGWVRGTGLMGHLDGLRSLVERDLGVRTFSNAEMGWLLTALVAPAVAQAAPDGPLRVDLTGGLGAIQNLRQAMAPLVQELQVPLDETETAQTASGSAEPQGGTTPALLSPPGVAISGLPSQVWADATTPSRSLEDMVVVVGAGELGPWGSSATRFDLEVEGELAAASVAELAWNCGLIRFDSEAEGGSWIDIETNELVAEGELGDRYREAVNSRCGIREFDVDGPLNPAGVSLLVEVFLDSDVVVSAADEADARAFAAADPDNSTARVGPDGDWQVVRAAGSSIRVPRRARLSRRVGAQIPSGFDPTRWGIPAEMAASVDRLSLWNLVATVEAFLDAGIEPEQLMARVHPARVGNTQGSGMGGMASVQALYRDTILGGDHANDLLQEGLGNVVAAYVMQSYVGGYGPMVHPVAACATAAVSIEDAVDKIRAGKADVIVAGGWDDLQLEGVLGFADMSATAASDHMEAAGFDPRQYSRANDRRRAGFVEAAGGGTLLLARGSVAAELGLSVRGVVVYATSFADGIQTSIPAPGLGALACVIGGTTSPLATALSEHGLSADDIAVVSKHDTSTGANDPNESELHHRIADQLGRTAGNPMMVVSQKTVTGHAKGGSAAWQTIGLIQILETGRVPGNRNLECLPEGYLQQTHLAYGHRSIIAAEPLKAGLLTSLGFGHVSAVLCMAGAGVFFAALDATLPSSSHGVSEYLQSAQVRRVDGQRRRVENRYGGAPAYVKRVDRRLIGTENSNERLQAEASLLTDPLMRLGDQGWYVTQAEQL